MSEITCPYCRHEFMDDDLSQWDGAETEVYCPQCDKTFDVIAHVSITFESVAREGNQ